MIHAPCELRIGISGTSKSLANVFLDDNNMDSAASYCGATHILTMGDHFSHYVDSVGRSGFPGIPGVAWFPAFNPFSALKRKLPSNDVVGNLGEGVVANTAIQLFGCGTGDVAPLKVLLRPKRAKTPDYLIRLPVGWDTNMLPTNWQTKYPNVGAFPHTWPFESKACERANKIQLLNKAWLGFQQIVSYWQQLVRVGGKANTDAVGFGAVVVFKYKKLRNSPPRVRIHLFLPKNQLAIIAAIPKIKPKKESRKTFEGKGMIYGV